MRTININLIGDSGKVPRKVKNEVITSIPDDIDSKTKTISIITVTASCVVFVLCIGIWLLTSYISQKSEDELTQVQSRHAELKQELALLTKSQKNLEIEKKILDKKFLAQKQVNSYFIPWHKVLIDIPKVVPKELKITEISKINAARKNDNPGLSIDGLAYSANALNLISYFILSINENPYPDLTLFNASAKTIKYNEKERFYTFAINTEIKNPSNILSKTQELTKNNR